MAVTHGKRRTGEAGAVRLRELEEAVHGVVRIMCDDCSQICDYWRIVLEDINKAIEETEKKIDTNEEKFVDYHVYFLEKIKEIMEDEP